jgi:hypothetical protein
MRRGGTRLVAAAVAVVLAGAAGCSDPAGAERQEVAAARAKSPSPTSSSKTHGKGHGKTPTWHQSAGVTKASTKAGLRVKTGHLFKGRVTIVVTDTKRDTHRTITASATPRKADVGRYLLTAIKVTPAGITFAYRLR